MNFTLSLPDSKAVSMSCTSLLTSQVFQILSCRVGDNKQNVFHTSAFISNCRCACARMLTLRARLQAREPAAACSVLSRYTPPWPDARRQAAASSAGGRPRAAACAGAAAAIIWRTAAVLIEWSLACKGQRSWVSRRGVMLRVLVYLTKNSCTDST